MLPGVALAGPWCHHLDEDIICRHMTADACYEAAGQLGGYCMPNAQERGIRGDLPYCLVTGAYRRCTFISYRRCQTAQNRYPPGTAGCVENTEKALELAGKYNQTFRDKILTDDDFGYAEAPTP